MSRHATINRAYRLIWSDLHQAFIAVAEIARGHGKRSGGRSILIGALLAAGVMVGGSANAAPPVDVGALPAGAQVTAGVAAVSQSGNVMSVSQSTDKAAINWQSFSVGSAAQVNFYQPSSNAVVLNRVVGNEQSVINGAINANGRVFILNSSGVLFGQGASVNTSGLVASTMNMSDADFMAGNYRFHKNGSAASVVNLGTINVTDGGYVALLGEKVVNQGVITARMGTVAMASGEKVTLNFNGDSMVGVTVDQAALNALVENRNAIYADGGQVILSAKAVDKVLENVVNNTGTIRAQTIENREGKIFLLGEGGKVEVSGVLDASAPNGGDGGFVETSGPTVKVHDAAVITTASAQGKTGTWLLDPVNISISESGTDDPSSVPSVPGNATVSNVTLQNQLVNTNIVLEATNDVDVNAPLSWSSVNDPAKGMLTLKAGNNVNVNSQVTVGGYGKLSLVSGVVRDDGGVIVSSRIQLNDSSTLNVNTGANGYLTFTQNAGFDPTIALSLSNRPFKGDVSFGSRSGELFTKNGISYYVINSLGSQFSSTGTDLQGVSGNLARSYALGSDIDASATSSWRVNGQPGGAIVGFDPLGRELSPFLGGFEGLGHVITSLRVNRSNQAVVNTSYIGLFGSVTGSTISNFHLNSPRVEGGVRVGAIVGNLNGGILRNVSAYRLVTQPVDNSVKAVTGTAYVGGIVGYVEGNSKVENAWFDGSILGTSFVGGLVGSLSESSVSRVFALGNVVGSENGTAVGGLVGNSERSEISNGFSGAAVKGGSAVGGLIGALKESSVTLSYSTSSVAAKNSAAGGLIGSSSSSIIDNTYSLGDVSAFSDQAGGLVGYIQDDVGNRATKISHSYTLSKVGISDPESPGLIGGLVGAVNSGSVPIVESSYWDVQNYAYEGLGQYKNRNQLESKATFQVGGWNIGVNGVWGFNSADEVLGSRVGNGLVGRIDKNTNSDNKNRFTPHLCVFYGCSTNELSLSVETIYGRSSEGVLSLSGGAAGLAVTGSLSSAVVNSRPTNTSNATNLFTLGGVSPTYVGGLSLVDTEGGHKANYYDISTTQPVSWRILKADLSGIVGAKQYDGNANFEGSRLAVSGVNGETLALTGTVKANSKNVAEATSFTDLSGATLGDGTGLASNYNLVAAGTSATIEKKTLTVAATAADKTYDGNTGASVSINSLTGLVGTETVGATVTGVFSSKDAGARTVTASYALSDGSNGGLASNYQLADSTGLTATIGKKTLTVAATAADKTYDGNTVATVGINSLTGLVGTETVGATATGVFSSKDAGARTVTASYALSDGSNGGLASNYQLADSTGLTATIGKKTLTVAATAADKTYDGNTVATVGINSLTGFVGTETVGATATGAFNSKDAGARTVTASYALSDGSNGGLASNYQLADSTGLTATIGKKTLTVAATAADKTYDGNTVATVGINSLKGFVGTETVGATATGAFNSKDAGARTVTASYALSDGSNGGLASNYQLADSTGLTATIGKKKITVAATASDRPYDETTVANISVSTASGLVGAEQLQISATGNFDSKEVGNRVATANFSLSNGANGGLASNYEVDPATGLVAKITPPGLTYAVNRIGGQVGLLMYSGSDLLASSIVSDTSLKGLFAGMGAPEVIGYSITRDGVAVSSIKESGNYVIRPIFGANGNYEINEAASSPLSIVVAANSIIEEAVATAQKSRPAAVNPNEIKPTSINDGLSKVVSIPSLGDSPRNVTLSEVSQSYSTPTQLALDLIFEDTAAGPLTGQQLSLDLFPSSIKLGNVTSSSRINVLSLGKEFRPATKTVNKTAGADRDVRVQVVRDSLLGVVNGGVKLPEGVSQEFYAVGGWQTVKVKESHESSDKYSMEATPAGAFAVVGGAR